MRFLVYVSNSGNSLFDGVATPLKTRASSVCKCLLLILLGCRILLALCCISAPAFTPAGYRPDRRTCTGVATNGLANNRPSGRTTNACARSYPRCGIT